MKAFNKRKKPKHFTKKRIKLWKIARVLINSWKSNHKGEVLISCLSRTDNIFKKGIYIWFPDTIFLSTIYDLKKSIYVARLQTLPTPLQNKIKKIIGRNKWEKRI